MAQTPLQTVKEKFGSKEKLVEALTGLLEASEDESKEEFAQRLARVPNSKLLHLHGVGESVKALGGKDALVTKVAELKGQSKDKDFVVKLAENSIGALLDMHGSLSRSKAT